MAFNKIFFQTSTGGNIPNWHEFVGEANKQGIPVFTAVSDSTATIDDLQYWENVYAAGNRANWIKTGYVEAKQMKKHDPNWQEAWGAYHLSVPPYRLYRDDGSLVDTRAEAEPILKRAARLHVDVLEAQIPETINRNMVSISSWNEIRGYAGWGQAGSEETWSDPVAGYQGYGDWIGWIAYYIGQELIRRKNEGLPWFRWAAFGFAGGNPETAVWHSPGMLAYLRLAGKNPEVLGLALHEYSFSFDLFKGFGDKTHIGRFEHLFAVCDQNGIPRPWVELKEFGWKEDAIPPKEMALRQLEECAEYYAAWPEIKGAAIWTAAHGWRNASRDVPKLAEGVYELTLKKAFSVPEEGDNPPEKGKYRVVVNLLPQKATLDQALNVMREVFPQRQTVLFSEDDALTLVESGNEESGITRWYDDTQPEDVAPNGDTWLGTLFAAPVGTEGERKIGVIPPGKWVNSNKYGNKYTNSSTGKVSYHPGVDLNLNTPSWNADKDADVYAAANGRCVFAGFLEVWGLVIILEHRDVCTRYGHVEKMSIEVGQWVQRGERIAEVGQDALKGPDHLHFDVDKNKILKDRPWDWPGQDLPRLKLNYHDPVIFVYQNRAPYEGDEKVEYQAKVRANLNMRAGPGTGHKRLLTIPKGSIVDVLAEDGPWRRVRHLKDVGYVHGGYLSDVSDKLDMARYFFPPAGSDKSAAFELVNNWGQGGEIVQLFKEGAVSVIQKNSQYELRRVSGDRVYFYEDTSRGQGEFYRIESPTGWMPRFMAVGDSYTRQETVTVYRKDGCQKVHGPYPFTSDIKLVKHHDQWKADSGVTVHDVVELVWLVNGRIDERYFYGAGHGLVAWEKVGQTHKSWIKRYAGDNELPRRERLGCP